MTPPCFYDDALPRFAALVAAHLGPEALHDHIFLRDAVGRLTLVLRGPSPEQRYERSALNALSEAARATLGNYVDELVWSTPADLFDLSLGDAQVGLWERLENGAVRVLERRLVGADWLSPPHPPMKGAPPIVVFASHKGGVGRSTALVVAAAELAGRGRNVLALDLDLEAPGLGALLLPDDQRPHFGALDFFVENGLRPIDDLFVDRLYGVSALTSGRGLVHVIPAIGTRSLQSPQNILGKVSRAYLEDPTPTGPQSFLAQTRDLLTRVTSRHSYDVVLVDTRAGLHESTAAALLGLGAHVLLFGVDTPQTFEGYRFLLAHLTRFIAPEIPDDWRWRLQFVHAKAAADPKRWRSFDDRTYELCQAHLYDADEPGDSSDERFVFAPDDPDAPHNAWRILGDSQFAEFDPPRRSDQLQEPVYARTFGSFLHELRERVLPNDGDQAR